MTRLRKLLLPLSVFINPKNKSKNFNERPPDTVDLSAVIKREVTDQIALTPPGSGLQDSLNALTDDGVTVKLGGQFTETTAIKDTGAVNDIITITPRDGNTAPSFSFGDQAVTLQPGGYAFGSRKLSTLIGSDLETKASGIGAFALGAGAQTVSGTVHNFAIGFEAGAQGNYSYAIGRKAYSTGNESVAFLDSITGPNGIGAFSCGLTIYSPTGTRTQANAKASIAIGAGAVVHRQTILADDTTGGIAIGRDAVGQHDDVVVIGRNSLARGSEAISIGRDSYTATTQSIAIGYTTAARGFQEVVVGHNSTNLNDFASADLNIVDAANAFRVGIGSSPAATEDGFTITNSGHIVAKLPVVDPTTGLSNNPLTKTWWGSNATWSMYLDVSSSNLVFVVKFPDNTIKTGAIALSV